MNLVTASIVEASLQSSELDRKEKKDGKLFVGVGGGV